MPAEGGWRSTRGGEEWATDYSLLGTWRMARNSEPALPNATRVKRGRLPGKLRHLAQRRISLMRIKLITSCSFKFETVVQYALLSYDVFSYWWLLTHTGKNTACIIVKLNVNFSFTLFRLEYAPAIFSRWGMESNKFLIRVWWLSSGNTIITLQVIWKVYEVWSKSSESEKILARN